MEKKLTITIAAKRRTDIGKGASRRLRHEGEIPAVIYGSGGPAESVTLPHNKIKLALASESIYSSVFDLNVDGKTEHVILKAIQRHPYKPIIMHMDLLRVSSKDIVIKDIPLHFMNENSNKAVKAGGMISHVINHVEIRCQAKDLPEFIEVDLSKLELNQSLHLSDLILPKGAHFTANIKEQDHNKLVAILHASKGNAEEAEPTENE